MRWKENFSIYILIHTPQINSWGGSIISPYSNHHPTKRQPWSLAKTLPLFSLKMLTMFWQCLITIINLATSDCGGEEAPRLPLTTFFHSPSPCCTWFVLEQSFLFICCFLLHILFLKKNSDYPLGSWEFGPQVYAFGSSTWHDTWRIHLPRRRDLPELLLGGPLLGVGWWGWPGGPEGVSGEMITRD